MLLLAAGLASVIPLAQPPSATFSSARDYVMQSPYAVAVADFNRDGKQDLAVANVYRQTVTVVLNGGATQTITVAGSPNSIAVGDFNADLRADIVVTNADTNTTSVALGAGDGTFQPAASFAVGMHPSGVAVADFNGDRRSDLMVVNSREADLSMLLGNGDGTFQAAVAVRVPGSPSTIVARDFNHDAKVDVAVNDGGRSISVLPGTGQGTFGPAVTTPVATYWISDIVAADFDADGTMDLAISDPYIPLIWVLHGDGSGAFATTTVVPGVQGKIYSLAVGDFNNDSRADLAAASSNNSRADVFIGQADGSFVPSARVLASGSVYSVAVADLNADGNQDLVTASLRPGDAPFPLGTLSIRLGKGDGTFQAMQPPSTASHLSPPATADFNGDGRQDIAVIATGRNSCALVVALGDINGSFRNLPEMPLFPNSCGTLAAGDLNGDSRVDLAVPAASGLIALFGNGDGTFVIGPTTSFPGLTPTFIQAIDFNGDGRLDVAWINESAFPNALYVQRGNGDGTFQPPTEVLHDALKVPFSIADHDGDSHLDIVAIPFTPANTVSLLSGNGDGTFRPPVSIATGAGAGDAPTGVASGDFNGDTVPDLAVANWTSGSVSVLVANGDGTFQPSVNYYTPYQPTTIAVADVNRDRIPDLVVLNANTLSILDGVGDGSFALQPAGFWVGLPNASYLGMMLVADLTSDGNADVLFAATWFGMRLLVNLAP